MREVRLKEVLFCLLRKGENNLKVIERASGLPFSLFIEHPGPEGKGYFFLGFRVWDTLLVSGSQSSPSQYLKGSEKA